MYGVTCPTCNTVTRVHCDSCLRCGEDLRASRQTPLRRKSWFRRFIDAEAPNGPQGQAIFDTIPKPTPPGH